MSYHYLLELDVGYQLKHWASTGTAGVYSHAFTEIDPANVYVDGTQYGERTTYAACTGTQNTWYVDRGTTIYVHVASNGDANAKMVKVDATWHFAREGTVIPKTVGTGATVLPIFWEGRMETVPSISYQANPDALGGGIVPSIGQVGLRNNDAFFDDYLGGVVWKNQPVRLYTGTGGTMPASFSLRQKMVAGKPTIDRTSLTIPAQTDLRKLRVPVNSGSTITVISGNVSVTNPAPAVLGPFVGAAGYYKGSSGTVGTYALAGHNLGTVTRVWNSGGTNGTIVGNLSNSGLVAAHPLAVMGQGIIYAQGTGATSGGTALFKTGEMMQWLLASVAKVPGTDIATADFSAIDTGRAINIMAWFGRNETVEDALDTISRSAFVNWSVGRDGKYTARLIKNRPSNPINNPSFESGSNAYGNNTPIEQIDSLYLNTSLSNSKMLFYNNIILKDSVAGTALYRNATSYNLTALSASQSDLRATFSLPTTATMGVLSFFSLCDATFGQGYEGVVGTLGGATTSGTITININKIYNGTKTQLAATTLTGVNDTYNDFGRTVRMTVAYTNAQATTSVQFVLKDNSAWQTLYYDTSGSRLGSGYYGFAFGSAGTALNYALTAIKYPLANYGSDAYGSLATTGWANENTCTHGGTITGNIAYDGTVVAWLAKPSGTSGSMARIAQGTTLVMTAGTRYICTMVAAKQSGDAGTFRAEIVDAGGNNTLSGTYSLGTGTWTRVQFDSSPNVSGTGTINIYPSYNSINAGTCWVDLVEVYPVKTLNSWQLQNFTSNLEDPINNAVAVRYSGTGTIANIPLKPQDRDIEARDSFYLATSAGTSPSLIYAGLETRIIHSLCYSQADAKTLADVVLDYYNKPRIRWEADFLDTIDTTINLWDTLYIESGRFPGIPDQIRLLNVHSVEDIHNEGVPKTRVGGEFVFDAVNDIMTINP